MKSGSSLKFSIVLADDDADDQYLILQAIREIITNHEVTTVNDGSQLMDLLMRRNKYKDIPNSKPDVILLDINMPVLDGFQALSLIRSTSQLKNIPTFVLSTSRAPKDMERSLLLGANAFYSKPHQFSQLKVIVREIYNSSIAANKLS